MLSPSKHLTLRQAQGERGLVGVNISQKPYPNTAHAEPVEASYPSTSSGRAGFSGGSYIPNLTNTAHAEPVEASTPSTGSGRTEFGGGSYIPKHTNTVHAEPVEASNPSTGSGRTGFGGG